MKGKLIKTDVNYLLEDDKGVVIASTSTKEGINGLTKQNCDEIFGAVDVDKLAMGYDLYEKINFVGQTRAYIAGFNKAMELNKDKVFTLEDIRKAYQQGEEDSYLKGGLTKTKEDNYIQSIQQPTEIDVEIVTEEFESYDEILNAVKKPILDSNGCLILKKL
jgi:hypothetical protein